MIHAFLKKGSFQDSVSLMLISRKLSEHPDVNEISVMMGTPANKELLAATGFWDPLFDEATPNDICISIKADTQDSGIIKIISDELEAALAAMAKNQGGSGKRVPKARRWESAKEKLPEANLLLVSVAGEYAAGLAEQALDDGKNVMIFSDNVTVQDEKRLKQKAAEKDLIVMGPDCGTAMLAGAPLAFANVLPQGVIGIAGASGTGIQELVSQIALLDEGITHAIGLGGRDLSLDIGGISALTALKMLANDEETKVIAFVSKPPAEAIREKILSTMKAIHKPVVALFLGSQIDKAQDGNVYLTNTIDQTARLAVQLAHVEEHFAELPKCPSKKIAGLYTGGTLASEMALILANQLGVDTDAKHEKGVMLNAEGHTIIDLGDDFYTVGRPHPMIDPSTREEYIARLANQPEVGVLLVDLVIGYGAQSDPATSLADAVKKLKSKRSELLTVIATVTGTEQDPQGRSAQIEILRNAGICVVNNLPEAALLAVALITPRAKAESEKIPLLEKVEVINAGIRSFADDLQASGTPVVHYQWAPVAGGNQKLADLLKKLK